MKIKGQPGVGFSAIPRISSGFYIMMRDDDLIVRARPDQPYDRSYCGEFYRAQLAGSAGGVPWTLSVAYESAVNWAKEGNDTWKDVITRGHFGTLFYIYDDDGNVWHPADHSCPGPLIPEDEELPWTIVKQWSHAVDGTITNLDYPIAPGITELYVLMDAVTASSAGFRRVIVSTDGGATYKTALSDYATITAAGATATIQGMMLSSSNVTTALYGTAWIIGLNLGNRRVVSRCLTGTFTAIIFVGNNDPITNIRINNTAGNLTGGRLTILGR